MQSEFHLRETVCLNSPLRNIEYSIQERIEHEGALFFAVKVFYMGGYYCYNNYHSVCTIKVDDEGYMDG